MNSTELQIVITAVNEAASQLASVQSSLSDLADGTAVAAGEMSDSMAVAGSSIADDVATGSAGAAASVAGLSDEVTTAADEMEGSFEDLNQKLLSVGIQIGLLGAAIAAPAVEAVKSATEQTEAFDQLGNTVENIYAGATAPAAGFATEVADLTAKVNAQKATIAEAQAALTKWTGSTEQVAAAHEKANATIATATANLQKYQQELDNFTNSNALAGGSAAATTAQLEAAAVASNKLGFETTDSATALTYLFSSTQNVNETLSAFQDSMDLAAKLQIPVAQAANDVVQAMNGQVCFGVE
jgi:chromosome segregation ATPase